MNRRGRGDHPGRGHGRRGPHGHGDGPHMGRGQHRGHDHRMGPGMDPRMDPRFEDFSIKRLLAHGDLRFVVLLLIEEKPRHGYELIKLIEAKSSGQYAPSPGVIYPTLTYLEETGLVKTKMIDEKKQYTITADGTEHLEENRVHADGILKRLEEAGAKLAAMKAEATSEPFENDERFEIREVFHAIKTELKASSGTTLKIKKEILQILKKTLLDIQKLKKD